MKKLCLGILLTFSIIFMPNVAASGIDTSISCPSTVYVGESVSCTIYGVASDVYLSGIKANYEITNALYSSFVVGGDWVTYGSNSNGFVIGNTSGGKTGRVVLGTLKVQPTVGAAGKVVVGITMVNATDVSYNDYDLASRSATISVIEKPAPTPTPDPTPTPNPTPSPNPSKDPEPSEERENVYLDSLEIVGYKINFKKDVYEYVVEVNDEVKEITIKATSKFDIEGTGKFKLDKVNNLFTIKAKGKKENRVYTIKVNKISNKVKNNKEEIEKALTKYDTVIIDLEENKDDLKAYQVDLNQLKENKKKLIYNIYNNKKLLYTYVFDGSKIDYILGNIDLKINFNTNKSIENLEKDKFILDMKYKSYLPKGTEIKIYNIKTIDKKDAKLFRINEENTLELVKSKIISKDNSVSLELEKGDLYVLGNVKKADIGYEKIVIIQAILIIVILLVLIYFIIKWSQLKNKNGEIS